MLEIAIIIVIVFFGIILVRTLRFTSKQIHVTPVTDIPVSKEAVNHLSQAVQFKTISHQDPAQFDEKAFLALHTYLEKTFPTAHATLQKEVIEKYSLLYTWKGTDPTLTPILLMAHLDVVPVEPGTESTWTHPPFSGLIKDGYIWGRGTMDIKCAVFSIFEAVESLLKNGFSPPHTIYLAFGHDEEVSGFQGASKIAALLEKRGISLEYVLDEGGSLTRGIVPGISAPVALVGVAEKGYVSLELTVESTGGHSSMPPHETAIGVLAKAVSTLERTPFPARIKGPVLNLFNYTGPEMPFFRRMAFANLWLFSPAVKNRLAQSPETDAMIRTTTAPTIIEGGTKENILPKKVKAVINFRILPGDTTKDVIDRVHKVINNPEVKVNQLKQGWEPSLVSDVESPAFTMLQKTVRQIYPGTIVAPYLVSGATDSRHYRNLTRNVFKFTPIMAGREDLKRIHGVDERIGCEDYNQCVRFFIQLIRNSAVSAT